MKQQKNIILAVDGKQMPRKTLDLLVDPKNAQKRAAKRQEILNQEANRSANNLITNQQPKVASFTSAPPNSAPKIAITSNTTSFKLPEYMNKNQPSFGVNTAKLNPQSERSAAFNVRFPPEYQNPTPPVAPKSFSQFSNKPLPKYSDQRAPAQQILSIAQPINNQDIKVPNFYANQPVSSAQFQRKDTKPQPQPQPQLQARQKSSVLVPKVQTSFSTNASLNRAQQIQEPNLSNQGTIQTKKVQNLTPSNLGKYDRAYNPASKYDIINDYFQIIEFPDQADQQLIVKISDALSKLIAIQGPEPETPESIRAAMEKITITEMQNLPESHLAALRVFWRVLIIQFQRVHPYCTRDGILDLIRYHVKDNANEYYLNGCFNMDIFSSSIDPNTGQIDVNSAFFIKIFKNLQQILVVFSNHVAAILRIIEKEYIPKFLKNEVIVQKIWKSFNTLYNPDYALSSRYKFHHQIAINLVAALEILYNKNSALFRNITVDFISNLDARIHYISRLMDIRYDDCNQNNTSVLVAKKCIKLANFLLLKFPYQLGKWNEQIKRQIRRIKSKQLYPFKWILNENRAQKISLFNSINEQEEFANKTLYFPIVGDHWFLLLKAMLQNLKNPPYSYNQVYKEITFFLLCSIIQGDQISFWTNEQKYQQIYKYIEQIYRKIQSQNFTSPHYFQNLGKLCRIMICASGKAQNLSKSDQIPQQLIAKLSSDTIMLQVDSSRQTPQAMSEQLANFAVNIFPNNIIGDATKQDLFSHLLSHAIITDQEQEIQIGLPNQSIQAKYYYDSPTFTIFQMMSSLITKNPRLLKFFVGLWNRQSGILEEKGQISSEGDQCTGEQLIYKLTFGLMTKMEQYFDRKLYQIQEMKQPRKQNLQIIPKMFQLLTQLMKNSDTRQVAISLLNSEQVVRNRKIKQMLQKSMFFEQSAVALTRHVQCLYEQNYQKLAWVTQICNPIIQNTRPEWEEVITRHYANITRIVLYKRFLPSQQFENLSISNLLNFNSKSELINLNIKQSSSGIIRINQLTEYSNYLLLFIKWALKVEEDSLRENYFYNVLYINKKFQSLQSALRLLQILIIVYIWYGENVYFPQNLRRFLASCQSLNILSLATGTKASADPQIELSNKKIATMPAVLSYLIASPVVISSSQFIQHESIQAKEVRSIALNVLNMIIFNGFNSFSLMMALQNNTDLSQISKQDPISKLDFNIYESFFVGDFQKHYCSAKKPLLEYLSMYLRQRPQNLSASALEWFQSSVNYGQMLDTITQINELFNSPSIRNALLQRIKPEFRDEENLAIKMRKFLNKSDPYNTNLFKNKQVHMPTGVMYYICDRQISALSRVALQLAICSNQKNTDTQGQQSSYFFYVIQVVINKLILMINSQQQSYSKNIVVKSTSTNIWTALRVLQTKKNKEMFVQFLQRFMPFILHPYHMEIQSIQYAQLYLTSIILVFACRDYLDQYKFIQVKKINKLSQMLIRLILKSTEYPKYYTVLLYCLQFFTEIEEGQISGQQNQKILESVYYRVDEIINPLMSTKQHKQPRAQLAELTSDINVISLMMFFREYIPEIVLAENRMGKKSIYHLILQSDGQQTSPFDYKSLLLNFQDQPTRKILQRVLNLGYHSRNYLQFVSACNYLHNTLSKQHYFTADKDYHIIQQIIKFVVEILDLPVYKTINNQHSWRQMCYKKGWACNLLYVLIAFCSSNTVLTQISQILFNRTSLLSLLGEVLSYFGQYQIKWPYLSSKAIINPKLGLLEKSLLHSILKIYAALVAKSDQWITRTYLGAQDQAKNNKYYTFCRSLVSASRVLNKNQPERYNSVKFLTNNLKELSNTPRTQYEQTLTDILLRYLFKRGMNSRKMSSSAQFRGSSSQFDTMTPSISNQTSLIKQIFPSCANVLDLVHDHYNLLITEKYLMILLGSYKNPDLVLESYQYNSILVIFQMILKRLIKIHNNFSTFEDSMKELDTRLWSNFRMNINLFYLNTVQESPRQQLLLLNSIAELCVKCIVTLKVVMQMHKDSRDFNMKADKIMKQAKKHMNIFKFDFDSDFKEGGFQNKSQFGGSYMGTYSTRMNR